MTPKVYFSGKKILASASLMIGFTHILICVAIFRFFSEHIFGGYWFAYFGILQMLGGFALWKFHTYGELIYTVVLLAQTVVCVTWSDAVGFHHLEITLLLAYLASYYILCTYRNRVPVSP